MLVIRLARVGKKNKPYYKFVIQEKAWSPKSKAIDIVGSFDPHTDPAKPVLNEERIKHWLSKGAQPSNTVHNMLVNAGLIEGEKKRVVSQFKKRNTDKADEKDDGTDKKEEKAEEKPTSASKEATAGKKEEPKEEKK